MPLSDDRERTVATLDAAARRRTRDVYRGLLDIKEAVDAGLLTANEFRAIGFSVTTDPETGRVLAAQPRPEYWERLSKTARDVESREFRALERIVQNTRANLAGRLEVLRGMSSLPGDPPGKGDVIHRFTAGFLEGVFKGAASPVTVGLDVLGPEGSRMDEMADAIRSGITSMVGLGDETGQHAQMVRGMALGGAGVLGQIGGDLTTMALAFLTGGAGWARAGAATKNAGRLFRMMNRTLTPGRQAAAWAGASGTGFVAGLAGFGIPTGIEGQSEAMERLQMGLTNAGGILFLGSILSGRPRSNVVDVVAHTEEMSAAFRGLSKSQQLLTRLGLSATYAPRLTVGNMLGAGAIGTVFETNRMLEMGASAEEAIGHGVRTGIEFMGWDVAASRMGSVTRVLHAQRVAAQNARRGLVSVGLQGAATGTAGALLAGIASGGDPDLMASFGLLGAFGSQAAVRHRAQRLAGRARAAHLERLGRDSQQRFVQAVKAIEQAEASGQPVTGALLELKRALETERAGLIVRMSSVLPNETIDKIVSGRMGAISRAEAADIAGFIVKDAWDDAIKRAKIETPTVRTDGTVLTRGPVPGDRPVPLQGVEPIRFGEDDAHMAYQELHGSSAGPLPIRDENGALRSIDGQIAAIQAAMKEELAEITALANAGHLSHQPDLLPRLVRYRRLSEQMRGLYRERGVPYRVERHGERAVPVFESTVLQGKKRFPAEPTVRWQGRVVPISEAIGKATRQAQTYEAIAAVGRAAEPEFGRLARMGEAAKRHPGPVPAAWTQTPEHLRNVRMTLDALLQHGDLTDEAAHRFLKDILGGSVRRAGSRWAIKVPGLGTIRDPWLRGGLERLRERLSEIVVPTGSLAAVGPVAGFHLLHDPGESGAEADESLDEGGPGVGWLANATGVATLGALGILVTRGRPVRLRGIPTQIKGALRKTGTLYRREGRLVLRGDGAVALLRGAEDRVDVPQGFLRSVPDENFGILFDFHNHPHPDTYGRLLRGRSPHLDPPAPEEVLDILRRSNTPLSPGMADLVAEALLIRVPSAADLVVAVENAVPSRARAVGAVITPFEHDGFTFYRVTKRKLEGETASALSRGVERRPAVSDRIRSLENRFFRRLRDELGLEGDPALASRGFPRSGADEAVFAAAAYRLGRTDVLYRRYADEVLRPLGVEIRVGMSDRGVERLMAREIHAALQGTEIPIERAFAEYYYSFPEVGRVMERAMQPAVRDEVRRLLQSTDPATRASIARRTGAEVAPAGSGRVRRPLSLESPSASKTPPRSIDELREDAAKRGYSVTVEETEALPRVVVRDAAGTEVARGASLKAVWDDMVRRFGFRQEGEYAATGTAIAASVPVAVGAGVLATVARRMLDEDVEGTAGTFYQTALFAGIVTFAMLQPRFKASLSRMEQRLVELTAVPVGERLSRAAARGHVGQPKLKPDIWQRMPVDLQVDHAVSRIDALVGKKAPKQARREALANALNKYVLNEVDETALDRMEAAVRRAGRAVDMNAIETERLWLGYLAQVATPAAQRPSTAHAHLKRLGQDIGGVARGRTADELRGMILAAKLRYGQVPTPKSFSRAHGPSSAYVQLQPDPAAEAVRKIMETRIEAEVAAGAAHGLRSTTGTAGSDIFMSRGIGSLRPPEMFRSFARAAEERGDPFGAAMHRLFSMTDSSLVAIERDIDTALRELRQILGDLTVQERQIVRKMMEGDGVLTAREFRAQHGSSVRSGGKNLEERADRLRALADKWAELVGIPRDARPQWIEDYFPWYYEQRTVRQLIREGRIGEGGMLGPVDSTTLSKFWRSLQPRTATEPLGPRITDPMEAFTIYLYGGVRKYHLDRLMGAMPWAEVKQIARKHPAWGRRYARWLQDIHGIPSEGEHRMRALVQGIGLDLEEWAINAGFKEDSFVRAVIDRWFAVGDPRRISRAIRWWEFHSKLWFNLVSPLVNMTQLIINTGTELGMRHVVAGAINAGRGKLVEKIPALAWIDPQKRGQQVLSLRREAGVFSPQFRRLLDEGISRHGERGFAGRLADRMSRFGTGLFELAEDINRSATVGAAESMFREVEALERGAVSLSALRRRGTAGLSAGGAATMAGVGASLHEDDPVTGALLGAAAGAGIGYGVGRLGRAPVQQAKRDLDLIRRASRPSTALSPQEFGKATEMTREEVLRLWVRQVEEMTQFRFGRPSRPEFLRTPMGESLFALQTYTLNQGEFLGTRLTSFARSVSRGDPGDYDLRVFKHLLFLMGAGAALTNTVGFMRENEDEGVEYWMGRIGFGLAPFVRWNESANQWQIENPGVTIAGGGPFISDVMRSIQFFHQLASNPEAQADWRNRGDRLMLELLAGMRQIDRLPDMLGRGVAALGMEGQQDMFEVLRPITNVAGGPLTPLSPAGRRGQTGPGGPPTVGTQPPATRGRSPLQR